MKATLLHLVAIAGLSQALRPWYYLPENEADARRCGGPVGYMDRLCGTRRYCEAFDGAPNRTDFAFASTKECFRSHEPEPRTRSARTESFLPWVEPNSKNLFGCGYTSVQYITEAMCGTKRYCEAFASVEMTRTDGKFTSKAACLAGHEPRGARAKAEEEKMKKNKKLPWIESTEKEHRCGIYGWVEETCGTQRYCDAFDLEPEMADGRFDNASDCYAAHEDMPAGYVRKSMKMAWKVGPWAKAWCDSQRFWHIACGTVGYCGGYDIDFNNTDARFLSTAACLEAFENQPQ
ncbi:hypothetical protein L249_6559 [Ophiocordyceps polyrhachis-furcata BCC 54312]|uniref:Uncharacterized protein n=1 Tax=Ophiocordyceps polyrhachis-furcata BCC 54312 TaxID=1330021 RepID=A0A367LKH9_9HYPO|nr:hypothetical protein L249_6559 [Ophiocordyceps polyrhachis-furcata BCC 54312]